MCWARCSIAEASQNSSSTDEVAAVRRKGKVQNAPVGRAKESLVQIKLGDICVALPAPPKLEIFR